MFGFGVPELLIVGAMLMLLFGVGRLPELGSSFGKAISNFKKAADGKDQIEINPKAES